MGSDKSFKDKLIESKPGIFGLILLMTGAVILARCFKKHFSEPEDATMLTVNLTLMWKIAILKRFDCEAMEEFAIHDNSDEFIWDEARYLREKNRVKRLL